MKDFPESMDALSSLFQLINAHTNELILDEIKYWKTVNEDHEGADDYIDSLRMILGNIKKCQQGKECVLRIGHGSGWRFITGAWSERLDKFEEEMRCLERIKDKICQCVEVEKEWEKKVKQVLDQVERDHPLLFKVILSILSSVILGLLTSYIWEGIHLDQVAIYSSPNGSEPVYSEVSAENVKLIQSQEDTEFYQVIIIEGERETAIGYIKEEDVIKLMEGGLK